MRVTFLFTDIESSTQLFQRYPHAYPVAVTEHHTMLAKAVAAHGGHVFETIGDAVFAAFPIAVNAVRAGVEAQRALSARRWAEVGEIRVRMGVHTGDAELREGRYLGPSVQRCEKMMSTGYGGQVLVSRATRAEIVPGLPEGIGLRDLGTHRLRGLASPEQVFQVTHPSLQDHFPPLKSLTTFLSKLPARPGAFIGRNAERTAISLLLSSSRLVTVTGPQGIGKTRLAVEVGAELLDNYPDGVWFVAVGGSTIVARLDEQIAETIGVEAQRVRSEPAALIDVLATKQLLLILDGCERSLRECAVLIESILHHSRHVRILTTSRELIAITGEAALRLTPLADPDALALFRERAAWSPTAVPESPEPPVAHLIGQLEGSPAAIEEAAREVATSPLGDVIARIAAKRWSDVGFALLQPSEQLVLQRLAVLEGPWTLEAAEAVASGGTVQRAQVLDLLASLVEKSVVVTETTDDGSIRYYVPELLRRYGQQRLLESGELDELRLRSRQLQAATTGEPSA